MTCKAIKVPNHILHPPYVQRISWTIRFDAQY